MLKLHRLRLSLGLLVFAVCFMLGLARAAEVTDPKITSWVTARSYARVYETASDKTSGNAVSTWPRAGLTNGGGGQATPVYSDIQRIVYSTSYVYVYATGLPSYVAGNWVTPNNMTYTSWPTNRASIHRIPRTLSYPTTKQKTNGSGGVLVNGVYVWANGDVQSYTTSTGLVSMSGQGIWNRLAGVAEDFNFDPAKGHQPGSGAYHNHVNPIALRYQLGDAVTYNSSTKAYAEGTPTKHSPLLGFANDGLPIYGPYGYATATDASSGVRRMVSGFVKRNGQTLNKSVTPNVANTNLASTGRTTLPVWAASVQGKSTTLASTEYGPNTTTTYSVGGGVTSTYSIGLFAEDYDYLGDLGYTQGTDFDLNRQNVRYCVTPEYPSGTYAYFVCIDSSGATVFPDIINQEFYGSAPAGQGTVTSITETVTDYKNGGQASALTLAAAASGANVQLSWPSVEGATYTAAYSADGTTYTNLSTTLTATLGGTATYTTSTVAPYYKITLSALSSYDTNGNGSVAGLNSSATATYAAGATAPSISTQPSSATVTAGTSVTFTVAASGTAPLSYQWYKTVSGVTSSISGATSASYVIASPTTADAGAYSVVVTNSAGSATSSAATLVVNAAASAPSITAQPSTATVSAGASVTFTVSATGTAPLAYQWYKNNSALSGATSATYTIASAASTDLGAYRVIVSNSAGSTSSDLAGLVFTADNAPSTASLFNAWQTGASSRRYARVKEQTASATTVSTWPSAGLRNTNTNSASQSSPSYADVQLVRYSSDYVYVNSSGLASHVMGPWYLNGQTFGNWPINQNVAQRFPRVPAAATAANRYATTTGANGLWVNGVMVFNMSDDYSYKNSTAADAQRTGDGIWNRDANLAEVSTFDPAYAHQPPTGEYHYHANPKGLRAALGDNVSYNAATNAYSETVAAATKHSPILGYAWDGYPIYGPYGYATAFNSASGIRRMNTGYQLRNGSNGTTNLTSTGRTTLPKWAATVQNRSQTLTSGQYGPAVSASKPLGTYQEDYDYLGDTGKTQGVDFDLDVYNGRFCVTPEYPNGTYAYFVAIDSSAAPVFPYVTGRQFYGVSAGGTVASITESVNEHKRGGPASAFTASVSRASGTVTAAWDSVEGATYTVQTSMDGTTYSTLASHSTTTTAATYATTTATPFYKVTLASVATYDNKGTGGTSGLGLSSTATLGSGPVITAGLYPFVSVYTTQSTSFGITVSSDWPVTYQWRKGGTPIAGATSATYTIASATLDDAGEYNVTASSVLGSADTASATGVHLTVLAATAPTITTQPVGGVLTDTFAHTLSVVATGSEPLSYQWYKNGQAISGATASTYLGNPAQTGTYTVTVTNFVGTATSDAVLLVALDADVPDYSAFLAEHFSPTELLDAAIASDTADPDADGFANLLEYAFDLDPRSTDNASSVITTAAVSDHLRITFPRRNDNNELAYVVEVSSDLSTWTSGDSATAEISATSVANSAHDLVTVQDKTALSTTSRRFMRVRVQFD